ncbi:MAG TPA: hypothetical protein DCS93_22010 [Microscillaceae bacterium]|nr:hypothetical protein [Microscillaceae bacterium]
MKPLIKLLLTYFLAGITQLNAQVKDTLNVAVLAYEGVELLDFAGPAEVFAAASYYTNTYHFKVHIVAKEPALTSQGFLKITPNFNFDNAPKTNILVLPGGNAGKSIQDKSTQQWIQAQLKDADQVLTVCSGIYFLKKSGRLNNIPVTSHHKIIPFLKKELKPQNVLAQVKYVDAGQIVTSAGVSSGIEGALLMVSKIAGLEAANRTARYMEYAPWDISNGKIAYDLQSQAANYLTTNNTDPHFGMLDLAGHLALREGKINLAKQYFQKNVAFYPNSALAYHSLSKALLSTKKWVPPTYEDFLNVLRNQGAKTGYALYQKAKRVYPNWKLFTHKDIVVRGQNLTVNENHEEARLVFKMGLDTYPNSWLLYQQLAICLLKQKKENEAKRLIQQASKKFPNNTAIKKLVTTIKSEK